MPKQKIAVRDKFYTLAKEQGYRARSAFKLLQLHRKYGLLDHATRAIDLCAAPGGWLQVLAKAMPPRPERQIIGVDLLPIKPLRGCVTFQADITSAECRRIIRHELKGNQADVVLCDGAPNVGSAFGKDAFVQSELALAALRFATDHLRRGGCFVTKVFRSADYNALIWAFQQLFRKVEATKPVSSRNVSAEIFVVCRDYIAPDKIDPKMLDPKYVFAQVDREKEKLPLSLLLGVEKKNAQQRFRTGYEDGASLVRKACRAVDFITSDDPVRALTEHTEIVFGDESDEAKFVLSHPATTNEIKSLCSDIKLLGKSDFRHVVKWRQALLKDYKKTFHAEEVDRAAKQLKIAQEAEDEEDDEVQLSKALLDLEESRKKEDKRQRKLKAKMQRNKDQGLIHAYALDLDDQEKPFSLKDLGVTSSSDSRLDAFRDGEAIPRRSREEDNEASSTSDDEPESYSDLIEKQLEADYERYSRRAELREPMSVQERRRQLFAEKKAKKKKSALERMTEEDFHRALEDAKLDAYKKGVETKMQKKGIVAEKEEVSEHDSEEEMVSIGDDDEEDAADDERETARAKAQKWFEQPLFRESAAFDEDEPSDDEGPESVPLPRETLDKAKRREKRKKEDARKERKKVRKEKLDDSLHDMDGLDEVRKRRSTEVEIVANEHDTEMETDVDGFDFDQEDARAAHKARKEMDPKIKSMIEKGMGKKKHDSGSGKIEFVRNDGSSSRRQRSDDDESGEENGLVETYESDDYDSDERAEHLAMGALLAKKSTRSAVLDAAYNRYAFNDDALPAWFAEDESRHNRPNLPVTKEMIESVKARFSDMNDRPVKKVAEARMRKKKRAQKKLDDAKRRAAALVNEPDLTGRSKMRAIEQIYRGAEVKRPGSVYVVSQKGGTKKTSGKGSTKGKKVKVVDPRMKKDVRALKRKAKGKGGNKKRHRSK